MGEEDFSPVSAHFPSVGECQCNELRVGGWELEYLHGNKGAGDEGEKEITFEMKIHRKSNKNR